jgi:hypothetical protein
VSIGHDWEPEDVLAFLVSMVVSPKNDSEIHLNLLAKIA